VLDERTFPGTEAYYDPRTNRLLTVKSVCGNDVVTSGLCYYWGDAYTNITRYHICRSYLRDCVRIINPKDHPELLVADYIGYHVISRDSQYLHFKSIFDANFTYDDKLTRLSKENW
jgi:hypothetical protein